MRTHLLAALTLTLASSAALGQADPATWNRNLERLDYYTSSPNGGDNAFFTYVANATAGANVVLLYPANNSMKEFTHRLYDIRAFGTGCANTYFNGLRYFLPTTANAPAGLPGVQGFFNATYAYPDPGATYTNSGQTDGFGAALSLTGSLAGSHFYTYGNWTGPGGAGQSGVADSPQTLVAACDAASVGSGGAAGDANSLACQACIPTNGYWLNPNAAVNSIGPESGVFSRAFLRFHPPKWTLLSLAYKRLVNGPLLSSLREAVLATNGAVGSQLVQKMLPQSCNGNGRPLNQKLGAIDGLAYTNTARPIAEMLFNTAWYMGGQDTNPWTWTSNLTYPSTFPNTKSGPCNGCASDFAILFSDGRGDDANSGCGAVPGAWCTASSVASCAAVGLGTQMDGDDFQLDPGLANDVSVAITGPLVRQTPGSTCPMDFADDVARWMATTNVSSQGTATSLRIHVVGIGENLHGEMDVLSAVASNAGGNLIIADDFTRLEDAIEQVFTAIRGAASSFASSAVTTVQTTGTSSAFIPRFTPAISGPWSGSLSRYVLFNEFAAGCDVNDAVSLADPTVNPNLDTSCSDFYLRDLNGDFIQENSNGQFVVSDDSVAWDGGWPALVTADGGSQLAAPYWEVGAKLYSRERLILAGTPPPEGARRIFTAVPSGSGYSATALAVTTANAATIAPLLGLGGDQTSEVCYALSAATGNSYANLAACASDVIKYVHGEDVLRSNPANRTNPLPASPLPRTNVLGDIFHSSPILVTPPAPEFLCDLGVINQCVSSLYYKGAGGSSYASYVSTQIGRASNVLVGANDGMLHAVNAVNVTLAADGGVGSTDTGTGNETWAFIPPDLLPKLTRNMIGERHELFVDGTAYVRDVWVDGSGGSGANNTKEADEFHTVAVFAQRQGGRGWTALDITDPFTPRFLWHWPKPGTRDAIAMGQTWNDIGGAAPPIGPIQIDDSGTPREKWVVAFGGGYDPNMIRGRSFHVLDVWTGAQLYRYSAADSSAGDLRRERGTGGGPILFGDKDFDGYFEHAVWGDMAGNVWVASMKNAGGAPNAEGIFTNWHVARAFEAHRGLPFRNKNPFFQRAAIGNVPTGETRIYLGSGDRAHLKDSKGGQCNPENISACLRRDCDVTVDDTIYAIGASPVAANTGRYIRDDFDLNSGANYPSVNMTYDSVGINPTSATTDQMRAQIDYAIDCPGGGGVTAQATAYCTFASVDGGLDCPTENPVPQTSVSQLATPTITDTRFYSFTLFAGARAQFTTAAAATTYDGARLTDTGLTNVSQCPVVGVNCVPSQISGSGWYLTHGSQQLPASTHTTDEKTAASALLFGGCVIWSTLDPNGVGGASGTGQGTCNASSSAALVGASCSTNADCWNSGPLLGTCIGGNDNGDTCDSANDCEGFCNGGRDNGDDCRRNSDCRDGALCAQNGNCSVATLCVGLGALSCTPSFPKDTAWSYQADAISGNISCGIPGSDTYLATNRAISKQVSVAPTQAAPVVSVNSVTGAVQYSALTLDATSAPQGATIGQQQISGIIHWLEVPRRLHDCRHNGGVFPSPFCQ
jgi:type IV pilus assembly protein PilY1